MPDGGRHNLNMPGTLHFAVSTMDSVPLSMELFSLESIASVCGSRYLNKEIFSSLNNTNFIPYHGRPLRKKHKTAAICVIYFAVIFWKNLHFHEIVIDCFFLTAY